MAEANREDIEKLEALFSANPGGRVFTHLAEAYRKAGELDRAMEVLHEGLQRHPEYSSAHVVLGRVLWDKGEYDQAERGFKRVLELDPQNYVALRALADLARVSGKNGEALRRYREILGRDPGNDEIQRIVAGLESAAATAPAPPPIDSTPALEHDTVTLDGPELEGALAPPEVEPLEIEAAAASATPDGGAEEPLGGHASEPADGPPAEGAAGDLTWIESEELPPAEPAEPPGWRVADEPDWAAHAAAAEDAENAEAAAPETGDAGREDVVAWEAAGGEHAGEFERADADEVERTGDAEHAGGAESTAEAEFTGEAGSTAEAGFAEYTAEADDGYEAEPLPMLSGWADDDEDEPVEVVTETLGDVYASSELFEKAAEVYALLLVDRPGDERLSAKLEDVRARAAMAAGAATETRAAEESADASPADLVHDAAPRDEVATPVDEPALPDLKLTLAELVDEAEEAEAEARPAAAASAYDPGEEDEEEAGGRLEHVESAWTGSAGAATTGPSPYGWAEDSVEPTQGGGIHDYFRSLLGWRPGGGGVVEEQPPQAQPAVAGDPSAEGSGSGEPERAGTPDEFDLLFGAEPEAMSERPAASYDAAEISEEPGDGGQAVGDAADEDDEDLEMFRSWLQSLKR